MSETISFLCNDEDVPALREAVACIAGIGYCEKGIRERLDLVDINDLLWRALPIYRKIHLARRDVLAAAIDLFLLQGIIPKEELNPLFSQADWDVLTRIGIVSISPEGLVRAQVSLFPVGDRLIFSEHAWPKLPHPGVYDIPQDRIMFVGTDSQWLARATIRRKVNNTLDLCTGSGIHALLAAAHSKRVVAVDINPRAALCTQFNAKAFGISNIESLVGDLFAPVAAEHFDLITANPPFVPSPIDTLGFRDGGRSGEDIQRRIIEALPRYLARGGSAQIVTELGERDGVSIADRIRGWLGDAPMDIHILRIREYTSQIYALGHADGEDYGVFLDSVNAWHENLAAQGYERIVALLLTIQWSDPACGAPWTRMEDSKPPLSDHAGIEIEGSFLAERLSRHPNLLSLLEQSHIQRTSPISFMEAGVLGNEARVETNAQVLGRALPVHGWLNPIEREFLVRMQEKQDFSGFVGLATELDLSQELFLTTTRSLLQRGLIALTSTQNGIG